MGLIAAPPALGAKVPVAAGRPHQIAGPGAGLTGLNGMSIARDGTGGVVFLRDVSGTEHVFVSRLAGGVFQSPAQVDTGLGGASGQPVIAAGNKGVLLVAFINSGNLYVTQTAGGSAPFNAPRRLHTGAEFPSLQLSNWGKAYLAFTATPSGGGHNIDAEYYDSGVWQPVAASLNVTPADGAGGTSSTRPAAATAGDGVGIVAWGENGHIYARRVWGTSPSVVDEQVDPASFGGANEVSSSTPVISVGGDSSYPVIAFDEQLSSGSGTWNRVLMTRLIAEDVGSTTAVDGLSDASPGSAGSPAVALGEYGTGFVLAGNDSTRQLIATPLANNGVPKSSAQISQGTSQAPIAGVPAMAGTSAALIAWEQSAVLNQPQVLMRYTTDGTSLGSPQVLSASGAQPQPADGLAAAGDNGGDAAVAWIQGQSGALSLEVAQLYQPPGAGQPSAKFAYARTPTPRLHWTSGQARWGPLHYSVTLGGATFGPISGTSLQVPGTLIDGPHTWHVTTFNPAGQTATSRGSTVFVDTAAPAVRFSMVGRHKAHRQLSLHLHAVDRPADQPGAEASTVATVRISWGDGSELVEHSNIARATHTYLHRGVFRVKVRVADRAGNRTTVTHTVRIAK